MILICHQLYVRNNMNVNEFGNKLRINCKADISLNINRLQLTSPTPYVVKNSILEADGLVVPAVPITVGAETFNANEYVEYTTKDGDIFLSGDWKARVYSTAPGDIERKITDTDVIFTVDP